MQLPFSLPGPSMALVGPRPYQARAWLRHCHQEAHSIKQCLISKVKSIHYVFCSLTGSPPVLPECMGTLTPANGEVINVGCSVSIYEGMYVNLDCGVIAGLTSEISYWWEHNSVNVSTERVLQVRTKGNYTCTVNNLDGVDSATTTVICK